MAWSVSKYSSCVFPTLSLYVECERRKNCSQGAHQDLIRAVEAPNVLLTDNAQTGTGKKWTKTTRDNATHQVKTVPHNQSQNQNKSEKTNNHGPPWLCNSTAGVLSCYWGIYFIVAASGNYSAQKELRYWTAMEKCFGTHLKFPCFVFTSRNRFGTTNQ